HSFLSFQTYANFLKNGINYKTYLKIVSSTGIVLKNGFSSNAQNVFKTDFRTFPKFFANFFVSLREVLDFVLLKNMGLLILSISVVIYSASMVVDSAVVLARFAGVSNELIGLTIVAIGTSLPELSTTITALRKGLFDIVLGTIIGSNIFDTLFVIGAISLIGPLNVSLQLLTVSIPLMLIMTLFLSLFIGSKKLLIRKHGIILIFIYALMMFTIFLAEKAF
ncbi:MAG: hypothetical protein Q7K42_04935, partial [Candidatus Diapherotrites archaeon]|nr:hypothetical protein [Candidatus Diapherotrites archaeon]